MGELSDPVEVVLQARVRDNSVHLDMLGGFGAPRPFKLSSAPVDWTTPLDREEPRFYVRGGVLPVGKALSVESVEVTALLGTGSNGGRLEVYVGDSRVMEIDRHEGVLKAAYRGAGRVFFDRENGTRVEVSDGSVEVRIHGRLVDEGEARKIRESWRWVPEGSEGYLIDGPIVMQVVGGGSLYLGRTAGNRLVDRDLWGAGVSLDSYAAHVQGFGVLPPGRAFEVRRVEYRARLWQRDGKHSELRIEIDGKKIVETDATKEPNPSGTWTGALRIRRGYEERTSVAVGRHSIGEATLFGTLVDDDGG